MEYKYTFNEVEYTVRLEPQPDGTFLAITGENTYPVSVERHETGKFTLLVDGQPLRAIYATEKGTAKYPTRHYVSLGDNITYQLAKAQRLAARGGGKAASSGTLTAQMPGQIMQVLVSEGDTVESGQKLIVMEAMKMEIVVTAPHDGTVKTLSVEEGETVERGQTLIEIE